MEYILTFGSTHNVLKAESVLKEAGLEFRLMPAPKSLSRYCDLVIAVKGASLEGVKKALSERSVGPKAVYRKEDCGYVEV